MRVAVWHNNLGPAAVFSIPDNKDETPQAAYYQGPWARPWRDLESRGRQDWAAWVEHLRTQVPYFGWWDTEEVPDDTPGLDEALAIIRQRTGAGHLGVLGKDEHLMTDQEALIIDQVLDVLGGENTDFYLTVVAGRVALTCGYQDCGWGETVGEIELWEFVTDARQHWDARHAGTQRMKRKPKVPWTLKAVLAILPAPKRRRRKNKAR